jgi:imidazolonepropionase-like amidohydrolase
MWNPDIRSRQTCRIALLASPLLALGSLSPSPRLAAQQSAAALTLRNVTVIDVTDGRSLLDQTVVVTGNRISMMGPTGQVAVPKGARIVDARGKYLVPGFWDMHAHLNEVALKWYPVFIAHGVTGLREMAQRFVGGVDSFRVWQREVAAGTRVGPRVVGPSADFNYSRRSRQDGLYRISAQTPEEVVRAVDSLKRAGIAFVKMHDEGYPPDLYRILMREARRVGLPVVGHYPTKVPIDEVGDSGQRSIEHVFNHPCWTKRRDSVAAEQVCAALAKTFIRNTTWLAPTISRHWEGYWDRKQLDQFPSLLQFIGKMRRLGVTTFLAGTDWNGRDAPGRHQAFRGGVSTLDEMVFFRMAGLTPLEALQTATLNPAKLFNATDSLGTVAQGKVADLVLLDADPLVDIENVMKIHAVIANGRYFDRAMLDALDRGFKSDQGLIAAHRLAEREAKATVPAAPVP